MTWSNCKPEAGMVIERNGRWSLVRVNGENMAGEPWLEDDQGGAVQPNDTCAPILPALKPGDDPAVVFAAHTMHTPDVEHFASYNIEGSFPGSSIYWSYYDPKDGRRDPKFDEEPCYQLNSNHESANISLAGAKLVIDDLTKLLVIKQWIATKAEQEELSDETT